MFNIVKLLILNGVLFFTSTNLGLNFKKKKYYSRSPQCKFIILNILVNLLRDNFKNVKGKNTISRR